MKSMCCSKRCQPARWFGGSVVDESMNGWTGATNVHITVLPNKQIPAGVCLKTLCDARTRVMLAMELWSQRSSELGRAL
jgi:hypothetical protein